MHVKQENMKTILSIDGLIAPQSYVLDEAFDVIHLWKETNPEKAIQDHAQDISGVVSNLLPVRRQLIEALPNLEIISNCAVGYNNIDLEACKARDIVVTNTPDILNDDTADTALLLILNVMRRAVEGDAFTRAGLWLKGPLPCGYTLSGKTLGILGLGRIGKEIAARATAFKMNIIYHGRNEQSDQPYQYYADLEEMAQASDVLVVICPGGPETEGLVDHKILKALGPGGYLVNVARGSVVDEDDLLIALRNKDIAGAGLDVYKDEPHVPSALFTMDNVVLTPHIGSATVETRTKMVEIVRDNLLAHFAGKPLLTPVHF